MSLSARLPRSAELAAERDGTAHVADAGAGRPRGSTHEVRTRDDRGLGPRRKGNPRALSDMIFGALRARDREAHGRR